MNDYVFRKASINDVDFLAEAIIAAEKSGSDVLSYHSIFGLTEVETIRLIKQMLEEEIDGCELSISSYWIAEKNNESAAAMGAWVEDEEYSSSAVKGSLIGCTLPKPSLLKAKEVSHILSQVSIEYIPGSLCIGIVYVKSDHRGKGLVSSLLVKHINQVENLNPKPDVYIQVFGNNKAAIKAYKKLDFCEIKHIKSENREVVKYLPSNEKYLLKRGINS